MIIIYDITHSNEDARVAIEAYGFPKEMSDTATWIPAQVSRFKSTVDNTDGWREIELSDVWEPFQDAVSLCRDFHVVKRYLQVKRHRCEDTAVEIGKLEQVQKIIYETDFKHLAEQHQKGEKWWLAS